MDACEPYHDNGYMLAILNLVVVVTMMMTTTYYNKGIYSQPEKTDIRMKLCICSISVDSLK
jgi:hypothetical protein